MKLAPNKISILAAFSILAVALFTLENFLPRPLPFLKIGLANVFVLLILWQLDFLSALIVSLIKVVLGSFISGLILTPLILFSLGGTIFSLVAMYMAIKIKIRFSIIGISIIGAVIHNLSQLCLAYFILFPNTKLFYFLPLLLATGLGAGIITGAVAYYLDSKINLHKILQVNA
ncbi:MAG: Gx transporter family protein [Candidatus Cloacimonetes bacterium]|nr:Gx transporter family protein [Candidatus Cloacimonadota bacterium]MBS3767873.1 Gx transporter family protein [Candidatus Cloacimonadota bacterium]